MKSHNTRLVVNGLGTQPLGAPPREDAPGLLALVSALAGANTPQEAARAVLMDLRDRMGVDLSVQISFATPRPEVLAMVNEARSADGAEPYTWRWADGDRNLGHLTVLGPSPAERAMLDAWLPWLTPAIKRLTETWTEREERSLADRRMRLWQIKAELLSLSQAPQSADAYLAQAVVEVQRLTGARQVAFWTYQAEDDSLEARFHAVPGEADLTPRLPLGVFQEVVHGRQVRTVALTSDVNAGVYVLGPVYGDQGFVGVLQATLNEPVLGSHAEEELTAAAEVIAMGLKTVGFFEKLSYQASHDPLTGLANRRTFQTLLDREFKLAKRHAAPLSLVVIDVDHFKRYNDSYGHAAGDALLMEIANTLAGAARSTDFVARFGGEEFVVVLPHTDREGALIAAGKLLDAVRNIHEDALVLSGQVTASLGVATYPHDGEMPDRLFEQADQAMYRAKQTGRNQVCQADN
ncbi:MAG: diguanylate cyclase [Cyanobacteria bacterium RYN_339]|nr:diguanylate cyclase [Cyanobacteria bacterium RYN_339]